MLKGLAYLLVFSAIMVPLKVMLVERKGGGERKAARMRLIGVLITTLITVGFYVWDLDNERDGNPLPPFALFVCWLFVSLVVGYAAERTIWRPFGILSRKSTPAPTE